MHHGVHGLVGHFSRPLIARLIHGTEGAGRGPSSPSAAAIKSGP
jgi:hypothetical protein